MYLDIIEEALAQAIGEPAIMAKFLRAASQVLQENSGGIIGNAQDSSKVGMLTFSIVYLYNVVT